MEFDDYGDEDYDQNYFYVEDSYDAAVSTLLIPDRAFPELGKEGGSHSANTAVPIAFRTK